MVASSKKKRGKQRKANRIDITYDSEGNKFIDKSQQDKCTKLVQKGNNEATFALTTLSSAADNISIRGMIPSILDFLKRCEDETFDQVLASVRGDLNSPSTWIGALYWAIKLEPSCRLQIAENIGPLVSSMCNDTDQVFFKSNKHWKEGIMAFVRLIYMMFYPGKKKGAVNHVIEALLQYDGLLTSIVQWAYWDVEHRPDIANELVNVRGYCELIVEVGRDIPLKLVGDAIQWEENLTISTMEGRNRVQAIGSTPIISKSYNPNCMVSYTAGLIRQLKTGDFSSNFSIRVVLTMIRVLVKDADCVDKGVISEVIDLGLNYVAIDYDKAYFVASLSLPMILENSVIENGYPNDTRAAFAVRSGLIDMSLSFIERFAEHASFSVGHASMLCTIAKILVAVHSLSLHQKTAKAIRSKKAAIEERLIGSEQNISNNAKCKKLLGMVRSILNNSGFYCCRCNKSLSRTEVKQCDDCGCMTYCSRACQKKDWLNGHNVTCNKPPTSENLGLFQGRAWLETIPKSPRIVAKLEEFETNLTMIQLKLFLANSEAIMNQASSLNLPFCDCVVVFDLRVCPSTITIKKYTEYYSNSVELNGFECSRSKENISCVYRSCFYNGDLGRVRLATRRLFPHAWLLNKVQQDQRQ